MARTDAAGIEHDGMSCLEFKSSQLKDSQFYRDSCIRCGLPEEAHMQVIIYYQDKILRFKNWTEARKKGFYPG